MAGQESSIDKVFDAWNRGDMSSKDAEQQLTQIVESATGDEKIKAVASLETVKAHS